MRRVVILGVVVAAVVVGLLLFSRPSPAPSASLPVIHKRAVPSPIVIQNLRRAAEKQEEGHEARRAARRGKPNPEGHEEEDDDQRQADEARDQDVRPEATNRTAAGEQPSAAKTVAPQPQR